MTPAAAIARLRSQADAIERESAARAAELRAIADALDVEEPHVEIMPPTRSVEERRIGIGLACACRTVPGSSMKLVAERSPVANAVTRWRMR